MLCTASSVILALWPPFAQLRDGRCALDDHPYSPRRLRGTKAREGLLWWWGQYRRDGDPGRPRRDERDSYAVLGMQPVVGKTYHSRPPLDTTLADITAAYDLALSPFERLVIEHYYVLGYGLPTLPPRSR